MPYLDRTRLEHPLHHVPVRPQHPRMMDPKPMVKQLPHLLIPRLPDIPPEEVELRMLLAAEVVEPPVGERGLLDRLGGLDGLLARVHEHHDLVALAHELRDFLVCDAVEVLLRLRAVGLPAYADEVLL